MYVTGGITNKGYSSEVWKYDLDTNQWQQAQVRATSVSFSCQTKELVIIGSKFHEIQSSQIAPMYIIGLYCFLKFSP